MVKEIDDAITARCRGLILQFLWTQKKHAGRCPMHTVDMVVVRSLLGQFGIAKTMDELETDIQFLEKRMYVKTHRHEAMGAEITTVELDDYAKGLFSGNLSDPAVLIDA